MSAEAETPWPVFGHIAISDELLASMSREDRAQAWAILIRKVGGNGKAILPLPFHDKSRHETGMNLIDVGAATAPVTSVEGQQ